MESKIETNVSDINEAPAKTKGKQRGKKVEDKTTTKTASKSTKTKTSKSEDKAVTKETLEPTVEVIASKILEPVVDVIKPKVVEFDIPEYVTVINGFQGKLVYVSKRTGEKFVWDEFGSEQEMELRELKNAKNSCKQFFENNWFMFEDNWIVDYLGVQRFYRNAINIDDFDHIFELDADAIKEIIGGMSDGQKKSAAYRARTLIADGEIDSNKAISALEEALGIELIER